MRSYTPAACVASAPSTSSSFAPVSCWRVPLVSLALATSLLAGCATSRPGITAWSDWQAQLAQWHNADIVLLGEQHDKPEHQAWQADTVRHLARQQRLAAVVLEMAPAGGSTAGLPASATDAQAQAALQWDKGTAKGGWPWPAYGPVVMAAVRAGVPVLGGNLPRDHMRAVMQTTAFDHHLPAPGWQLQLDAIREGHCGLLPESQLAPMARIQLARDQSMAEVAQAAVRQRPAGEPLRQVLLVSGGGHSRSDLGIPTWLPPNLVSKVAIAQADQVQEAIKMKADWWQITPAHPPKDPCVALREQFKARP